LIHRVNVVLSISRLTIDKIKYVARRLHSLFQRNYSIGEKSCQHINYHGNKFILMLNYAKNTRRLKKWIIHIEKSYP